MAFSVCPRCEGKGAIVNPSVDGHGIGAEEMDELGPEFFEDYMSGLYDISCPQCKGQRVVPQCSTDGCERPIQEGYFYGEFPDDGAPYAHCYQHLTVAEASCVSEEAEYWAEVNAERMAGA